MAVVPSLLEPFGLVAIEAMAYGRPVVASRTGGLAEIVVDGETGRLVPPGDPQALAQALEELLGDPRRALWMGEAGRLRFESLFTLERMVENTLLVYDEASHGGEETP